MINKYKNYDFIGLQETGNISEEKLTEIQEKGNYHIFNNTDRLFNGVISLISLNLKNVKSYEVGNALKGRLLHNSFSHEDKSIYMY